MSSMPGLRSCLFLLLATLCTPGAAAANTTVAPTTAPATLPELTYKDAQGKDQRIDTTTRRIYFSADRAGDAMLKEALEGAGQAALDAQAAVVVADLSAAPRLIRPLIRSSLRDRRYTTLLDEAGEVRKLLPLREDHVTVVDLDRLSIRSTQFISDAKALRDTLGIATTP